MANEIVVVIEQDLAIPFTVADGTGIEKGALCKMTDPMTAIITSGSSDLIAGVAASEKIASSGLTKLGMYRKGIIRATASGAITLGAAVASAGGAPAFVNCLYQAPATASGAAVIGYALETMSDAEVGLFQLDIGCGGNRVT